MDVAEKKKEYEALTALSNWIGYGATAFLIVGILWLKSFYWWLSYQVVIAVLVLGILITVIAIDLFG